jgi:menaquinone-dependent protoporphyrinogen oxidase
LLSFFVVVLLDFVLSFVSVPAFRSVRAKAARGVLIRENRVPSIIEGVPSVIPAAGTMRVLVAYASRAGSTKGIAEYIGEELRKSGIQTEVKDVANVSDLESYDAIVIGSALYMYHWLKEARQFVEKNHIALAARPVWIFSSGPTGLKPTDPKGRDLKETSGPKEIEELRKAVNPRDHRVFFGAFYADRVRGAMGFFARRTPKDQQGDFRNWEEIGTWADAIAKALMAPPQAEAHAYNSSEGSSDTDSI